MFIEFLPYFFVFIFGLCIGSFLNCVIYRLEQKKSLKGRSFCPHCKHKLFWQDLFPVFSFLLLGGRCRYCKKSISWQYPIVELFTGILFILVFSLACPMSTLYQYISVLYLFYISSALIVIFVYDLKHYIIPDKVLFPAIITALIYNFILLLPGAEPAQHMFYTFLAAIIASGFFLIIFLISKGKWMGFGDVKLAVLMGLLLGLPNVLAALFLAFFFGAIIGIILMVFKKKSLKSEIPFGPFLIFGTFMAMLYGNQMVQWYMHLFLI